MAHKLTILALDAVVPLDLAIAAQLMGYPMAPYDVTICGLRPGRVTTTSGFAAAVSHGLRALAAADTVMIPGFSPHNRALQPLVLAALRRAHRRGTRMVSICTGAFALAQAGILDGRRAATHWRHASALAASFPAVTVDPDVLYVDQGQVLTSAGVAAGIDLCLHLIRADHGARAANAVARQVVIAPHRDGGQAQYIRQPVQAEAGASLAATRAWAQNRLATPMTVRDLARHASVSERTFAETCYTAFASKKGQAITARLIVRRVRDLNPKAGDGMGELFPVWRYHPVFTDSPFGLLQAEAQHRDHAVVEQVFADWTDGPMAHLPSGSFAANAAWLTLAAMSGNLVRAAGCLASAAHARARGATIRRDLIDVAARTARRGRGHLTLHLPEYWHREAAWLSLFEAACGPPQAQAA